MRIVLAVYFKELKSYFSSQIFYIISAVFMLVIGNTFKNEFFEFSRNSMRIVKYVLDFGESGIEFININAVSFKTFNFINFILLLIVPLLTMRLYAEEKKNGTMEFIMTSPITTLQVLLGKFFCGWVCPFGLYMDALTYLRKAVKIPHRDLSENFNKKFHQLGYVILALLIVLSVIFASEAIAGSNLVSGTEEGGFVYQYFSAPFCQVCPMKPFCVLLQSSVGLIRFEWIAEVTTGQLYELGYYVTSLNLIVFGVVTAAAFLYRRAWCRICPLGALIALFNRFPPFKWVSVLRLDKVEEKCTKCGICKRVCPTQVTEVYDKKGGDVTTSKCILCLRCVEMCPHEDALQLKAAGKTVARSRNWLKEP